MVGQMILAYSKLPEDVTKNVTLIGGWFVFLANFIAAVHIVFLGAALCIDKVRQHPLSDITTGEWFTKIMAGVWIVAIAGDIAAVVIAV